MTLKILVADESTTIQKIVGMAFENEDAEVQGIGDGKEAFDKIMEFKPDIVLADVDMPGISGFQLSKKIKENPDLANIKVLLLASDFEDFDKDRFNRCQAENHISKPFKSDDIVQMVDQVMEGVTAAEIGEGSALQERVAEKEKNADDEPSLEELLESVEKLSTDSVDIAKDPIEEPKDFPQPVELEGTTQELEEPKQKEKINEEQSTDIDDDILGEMTQELEIEIEKKSSTSPAPEKEEPVMEDQTFSDEVYAEVQTGKVENLDDLDSAFKEIVAGEKKQQQQAATSKTKKSEMSLLGGIIPEPEDLLERMAPRAFSESGRRSYTQEEINENLSAKTDLSSLKSTHYSDASNVQEMEYSNKDDRFIQVTGEQVRDLLGKSLDSSLQQEMSGLSDIIVKTIREVVREIAPEIARSVIREEIEKIKNL
tara:strand:- start:597 stop:1877 length:1281 start_codon:yes stop_codon:yes gene_type:complete